MLGMRRAAGVPDAQVAAAAAVIDGEGATSLSVTDGATAAGSVAAAFAELEVLGLAEHRGGRIRPTERGWLCGNELYGRLLDLAP